MLGGVAQGRGRTRVVVIFRVGGFQAEIEDSVA